MNPVLEEEEGEQTSSPAAAMLAGSEKETSKVAVGGVGLGTDYSSGGSGSNQRNSSPASTHHGKENTINFLFISSWKMTLGRRKKVGLGCSAEAS